ncbi:MAG: hypothetical protein RIC19_04990 [Phaeodactylibacter sp.]|uniref:hypothetical protein n=1 Tax=Phaeodactylibacter sp. TaxID=1940289 RepID=UPI0032EC109B
MMNRSYLLMLMLAICALSYTACNDDDADGRTAVEYNPNCCVYGTMQRDGDSQRWEVAIDLESGAWDSIPGTRRAGAGFQVPVGVNRLNDFAGNRHLYTDFNGFNLVVQDLVTFDTVAVPLNDPETGLKINGSLFLQKARSSDEYFLFSDLEDRVYRIDLGAQALSIALDTFQLGFDLLNDFIYSPSEDYFVFLGQVNQGFTERLYTATIFDNATKMLVARDTFPQRLFGFVPDPDLGRMFALTFPENGFGYRLYEVRFEGEEGLSYTELSASNLAIGQLSEQLQTLHTSSNSYLCYGDNSSAGNPLKVIFQVDLSTGELISQIVLDDFGTMIKLDGE